MNIVFLTQHKFTDIHMHSIYSDLMLKFVAEGHHPYIITPREKSSGEKTELLDLGSHHILKVGIGDISNVSMIKKGIATLMLEKNFIRAIKKHLPNVKFDLILYSTPPVTFSNVIRFLKNRDHGHCYLMLKDIFPQNAVDLGMFQKSSPIYKMFRSKERKLYALSDRIGCMTPGNVDYLLKHNPEISKDRVGLCPNSIYPVSTGKESRFRKKYNVPEDKVVFVYGGNLGKPQDIPFVIRCMEACADMQDAYFLIAGSGTDYATLERYAKNSGQKNLCLLPMLPREEYESLAEECDVGLIFLDHRFTIPNFPSRVLSYMQGEMPILAATDCATDLRDIISEGGFGWWCESTDPNAFREKVIEIIKQKARFHEIGMCGRAYLEQHYTVDITYHAIVDGMK